jgi:hypothetical protein
MKIFMENAVFLAACTEIHNKINSKDTGCFQQDDIDFLCLEISWKVEAFSQYILVENIRPPYIEYF